MGLLVIVAALVSFAAFALTHRWKLRNRIALAVVLFVLLAVAPIAYIIAIGDQPGEGSRTWTQEELKEASEQAQP